MITTSFLVQGFINIIMLTNKKVFMYTAKKYL